MWRIVGTVTREHNSGYTETRQVPTFYLDPKQLGILSEEGTSDCNGGDQSIQ